MTAIFTSFGFLAGAWCTCACFFWAGFRRPPDREIDLAPEAEASPHYRSIVTLREHTFEI